MLALGAVQAELKERLHSTPTRTANARVLIDFAVGQPICTTAQAAKAKGMGQPGAKKLIDSMVSHEILAPFGDRIYQR